jgi:hypothetical protein
MVDLYRKERRRKRLQKNKEEDTTYPKAYSKKRGREPYKPKWNTSTEE